MYTGDDVLQARRCLKRAAFIMAAVLAIFLAGYVAALVEGSYALTALLAAGMLVVCLFLGDLLLAPRLRYARFLKDMGNGLRRSVDCRLVRVDEEIQMQDGVPVRALQVVLSDGDSRVFYLNASKLDFLPEMGRQVCLVSFGRHVVEFLEI